MNEQTHIGDNMHVVTVEESLVSRVNKLVKEAFGSNFDGTWHVNAYAGCFKDEAELGKIRKESLFFSKSIGRFDNQQGSSLLVLEGYEEQAETYSCLFEAEFGFAPEVTIVHYDD